MPKCFLESIKFSIHWVSFEQSSIIYDSDLNCDVQDEHNKGEYVEIEESESSSTEVTSEISDYKNIGASNANIRNKYLIAFYLPAIFVVFIKIWIIFIYY